jgi:transcriptional regulator with XRE-family HTH domain
VTSASTLGVLVRDRRKALGYSREKLAAEVGCSLSTIIGIEKGTVDCPRGKTLRGLSEVLGVTTDELLSLDSKNPRSET